MAKRQPEKQLDRQPVPNLCLFLLPGKVNHQSVVDYRKKHGKQSKLHKEEVGEEEQPDEDALVVQTEILEGVGLYERVKDLVDREGKGHWRGAVSCDYYAHALEEKEGKKVDYENQLAATDDLLQSAEDRRENADAGHGEEEENAVQEGKEDYYVAHEEFQRGDAAQVFVLLEGREHGEVCAVWGL